MNAYLDSSVILRLVLDEPGRLREWDDIDTAVTSELAQVECLRTLDRLRARGGLDSEDLAIRRAAVFRLCEAVELVDLGKPVLARAADQFPTPLGTLDALHLATALLWKQWRSQTLVFATHDAQLGTAARSVGLEVYGT